MKSKYTKEILQNIVKDSDTWTEVLEKLNIKMSGGSFRHIKALAQLYELDVSHFLGRSSPRRRKYGAIRPVTDYLYLGSTIQSSSLRPRLILAGIKEPKCEICGLSEWMGSKIPLELDHINGNHIDNRIENLSIKCSNCHAQAETKRRKERRKKGKKKINNLKVLRKCVNCGMLISDRATRCRKCRNINRIGIKTKIVWPPIQELEKRLKSTSFVQIGRELGVSDNAVRKHIRNMKRKIE